MRFASPRRELALNAKMAPLSRSRAQGDLKGGIAGSPPPLRELPGRCDHGVVVGEVFLIR
jgi:hypothetical protein